MPNPDAPAEAAAARAWIENEIESTLAERESDAMVPVVHLRALLAALDAAEQTIREQKDALYAQENHWSGRLVDLLEYRTRAWRAERWAALWKQAGYRWWSDARSNLRLVRGWQREYEGQKQRAEAAEAEVQRLRAGAHTPAMRASGPQSAQEGQ